MFQEYGFLMAKIQLTHIISSNMNDFNDDYFAKIVTVAQNIDKQNLNGIIQGLVKLREDGGRLFFLGAGGSAANCSHAVNDFRKLANIEAYAPTDNVAELTARTNDEGWETVFGRGDVNLRAPVYCTS